LQHTSFYKIGVEGVGAMNPMLLKFQHKNPPANARQYQKCKSKRHEAQNANPGKTPVIMKRNAACG
jgi:hypothetical protein